MDPPLRYEDPDNNEDLLARIQGAVYALHRYADQYWVQLGHPHELKGPLRLILRQAEHGGVPCEEWWAALEKFLSPAKPDWGTR
jgi:hypothetical protein